MADLIVNVSGMSCHHCVEAVQTAVGALAGVESVEVDLDSGSVSVTGSELEAEAVNDAIRNAGYDPVA